MTPSDKFYHTLFTGQAVICGQTLPKLTLWRLASLEAIQSPFVATSQETTVTPVHLMQAIAALHCEYPDPPSMELTREFAGWVKRMQDDGLLWLREAKAFMTYLRVYSLRPEMWDSSTSDARHLTAPPLLAQVVALMGLGISHSEAWGTCPGYAAWLIMANAERQSDKVTFFRDEDLEEPDLPEASEEEIREAARAVMGPEKYDEWIKAREARTK